METIDKIDLTYVYTSRYAGLLLLREQRNWKTFPRRFVIRSEILLSKKSAERIATLVKSAYTYEVIVGSYATDRHVFNLRGERMHVHLA